MRAVFICLIHLGLIDPYFIIQLKHNPQQCFCSVLFSMVKAYDYTKCGGHHTRPINRHCKVTEGKDGPLENIPPILKKI